MENKENLNEPIKQLKKKYMNPKELDLILQEFDEGNMCLDTLKSKLLLLFSVSNSAMNKQEKKRLLEVAKKINETAQHVYSAFQGATDLNFFKCRIELEGELAGWLRESRSLEAAISIYELYTDSEGQDVYEEIIEAFPEISKVNNLAEIKI